MTKLTVEITDEKFIYEYEVGSSKHSSTSPMGAEFLVCFTELLKRCSSAANFESDKRMEQIKKEAYLKEASES